MITKEHDQQEIRTNETDQRADRGQMMQARRASSNTLMAIGIIEIILGVLAMITPVFTAAVFVILLGITIMISGILEIIRATGRMNFVGFFLGAVGIIAGGLVIAQPLAGLGFLTFVIASYLLVTGVIRLFGKDRQSWARVGGAIGIILGILAFVFLPSLSGLLVGLIVGVSILIDGILTTRVSLDLRQNAY